MSRLKLSGQFGRLIVIRQAEGKTEHTYYLCSCVCGKQIVTRASYLRTGRSRSCGCLRTDKAEIVNAKRFKELTGKKFGRLRVGELWRKIGNVYYWETRCDCGNSFMANGETLKQGITRSCGCLRGELIGLANKRNPRNRGADGRFQATAVTTNAV